MKVFTILTIVLFIMASPLLATGQPEEAAPEEENSMMMMVNTSVSVNDSQLFIRYKDMDQVMTLAQQKPTVLFFNATWCPTCKAAREDFTAKRDQLNGVNLVLVDYDNSDDLQAKYGVTYQHTFVQVDSNGMPLVTWNGGATKELLENIVKGV